LWQLVNHRRKGLYYSILFAAFVIGVCVADSVVRGFRLAGGNSLSLQIILAVIVLVSLAQGYIALHTLTKMKRKRRRKSHSSEPSEITAEMGNRRFSLDEGRGCRTLPPGEKRRILIRTYPNILCGSILVRRSRTKMEPQK